MESKMKYCKNCKKNVTPKKSLWKAVLAGLFILAGLFDAASLGSATSYLIMFDPFLAIFPLFLFFIAFGLFIWFWRDKGKCPICNSVNWK